MHCVSQWDLVQNEKEKTFDHDGTSYGKNSGKFDSKSRGNLLPNFLSVLDSSLSSRY